MSEEWNVDDFEVEFIELGSPNGWWYLSFATQTDFLGGVIVQGGSVIEATKEAWRLGINPGGEVLGVEVPPEFPLPPDMTNRLLAKDEVMTRLRSEKINSEKADHAEE